jgi:hypothetical protein
MALYLAEGGDSDKLLGVTYRHVLMGSTGANVDYARHPSRPRKDVLLLGERAFGDVIGSIKIRMARHGILIKLYRRQIEPATELMHNPDMFDLGGTPCLLVVKNGNATRTTTGSANGVLSIVRDYFHNDQTRPLTRPRWNGASSSW